VAMSAGAAMVGSAFGPTNPFQAGVALRLAQLPPLERGGLRVAMLVTGFVIWVAWTMRYAARHRIEGKVEFQAGGGLDRRHISVFCIALAPMAAYVYGALRLGWGLNELTGGFIIAGLAAGLISGLGLTGTVLGYLEGMTTMLPAAILVGMARSISIVLAEGHVVDTILHAFITPLSRVSGLAAGILMIPFHALIHVAVPSVSGHAALTMPLFVPVADVLGFSRHVSVLAYQTGAGLMEMATPTNGALMAVLLAAGVPLQRWLRFAAGGILLLVLVGIAGIALAQ
jgi:uncharacterized ion transporter superfamily protein YfcC